MRGWGWSGVGIGIEIRKEIRTGARLTTGPARIAAWVGRGWRSGDGLGWVHDPMLGLGLGLRLGLRLRLESGLGLRLELELGWAGGGLSANLDTTEEPSLAIDSN